MMNDVVLYLDMDGVICNFDKFWEDKYGVSPKKDRNGSDHWLEMVREHRAFANLEFMPDAAELLAWVKGLGCHVEILTSASKAPTHFEVRAQKIEWLKKHNITYKPNFVWRPLEKSEYAGPKRILIDDTPACVEPFTRAGGVGILHKSGELQSTIDRVNNAILQFRTMDAMRTS